jgi:predicted enzyme related to lactoylglutathione lyase
MTASRIAQWTLDVQDVALMARFWSRVLDYRVDVDAGGTTHLQPGPDARDGAPTIWLQECAGPKQGKNRGHLDLETVDDLDAEIERLLELGAQRVDVGQSDDDPFVVFADPEGNEFCLLKRRPSR